MKLRRWKSTNFFDVHSLQFPNPWSLSTKCLNVFLLYVLSECGCQMKQHFTMDYYTHRDIIHQLIKNFSYKLNSKQSNVKNQVQPGHLIQNLHSKSMKFKAISSISRSFFKFLKSVEKYQLQLRLRWYTQYYPKISYFSFSLHSSPNNI